MGVTVRSIDEIPFERTNKAKKSEDPKKAGNFKSTLNAGDKSQVCPACSPSWMDANLLWWCCAHTQAITGIVVPRTASKACTHRQRIRSREIFHHT